VSYSHIDGRLVGKPNQGPNKGKAFEFSSQTKVTFDPDTKYETMSGRRQRPIYTITKASKPKISIEFSSAKEKARWWKFMFGGGAPTRGAQATFSHVFTRPNVGTMAWRFINASIPAPGYDSGDSGVTDKMECPIEDAQLDGKTVFQDSL